MQVVSTLLRFLSSIHEFTYISDIPQWINRCNYGIAADLYTAGNLEEARDAFAALSSFEDSQERVLQCKYEIADALFASGAMESAYYAFRAITDYSDASDRAQACTQPLPGTGVLYQADGTYNANCIITFDYSNAVVPYFYKIYSGDNLVATIFLNPHTSTSIYLQPGDYVVKEATGDAWFGTDLAFGVFGQYTVMVYDETGSEYLTVSYLYGYITVATIVANVHEGNITPHRINQASF